jgi:broad specificity phosphatase PhoE
MVIEPTEEQWAEAKRLHHTVFGTMREMAYLLAERDRLLEWIERCAAAWEARPWGVEDYPQFSARMCALIEDARARAAAHEPEEGG